MHLQTPPELLAICRLGPNEPVPHWAMSGEFWSVTRTYSELSIVCPQKNLPQEIAAERNWRVLKVIGPLPFDMVGVLSSLTAPLAEAGISVFALATYDTDYLLIRTDGFEAACQALVKAGHIIDTWSTPSE